MNTRREGIFFNSAVENNYAYIPTINSMLMHYETPKQFTRTIVQKNEIPVTCYDATVLLRLDFNEKVER